MSELNPNLDNPMGCRPLWSLSEMANMRLQYQADYNERLSLTEAIEEMGPRFPLSMDHAVDMIRRGRHSLRIAKKHYAENTDKLHNIIDCEINAAVSLTEQLDDAKQMIASLNDELADAKQAEESQFQAKWDALGKLDDYQDAIDQLRADNEKLTKQLDNAQCDKVAAMNAGKGWMVRYNNLRRKNFELVQCIEDGIVAYKEG